MTFWLGKGQSIQFPELCIGHLYQNFGQISKPRPTLEVGMEARFMGIIYKGFKTGLPASYWDGKEECKIKTKTNDKPQRMVKN